MGGKVGCALGLPPSKVMVNAALSPRLMVSRSSETVKFAACADESADTEIAATKTEIIIPQLGRGRRIFWFPRNRNSFNIAISAQSFACEGCLRKYPL